MVTRHKPAALFTFEAIPAVLVVLLRIYVTRHKESITMLFRRYFADPQYSRPIPEIAFTSVRRRSPVVDSLE